MKRLLVVGIASAALAAPAIAADLGEPVYKAPYMPVAPAYDWTGFYVGGHGSVSWSHTSSSVFDTPTGAIVAAPVGGTASAVHGGGQIGFDYMLPSRVVIGFLADVSSGETRSSTTVDAFGTSTSQSQTYESGTVRGRLGYAFDRVLLYGTGGWVWSNGQATRTQVTGAVNLATAGTVETVSTHTNGWTGGGGVAVAFAQNWNAFVEYRYSGFGNTVVFPLAGRSVNSSIGTQTVEAGVNYKLDWGPLPTRY